MHLSALTDYNPSIECGLSLVYTIFYNPNDVLMSKSLSEFAKSSQYQCTVFLYISFRKLLVLVRSNWNVFAGRFISMSLLLVLNDSLYLYIYIELYLAYVILCCLFGAASIIGYLHFYATSHIYFVLVILSFMFDIGPFLS